MLGYTYFELELNEDGVLEISSKKVQITDLEPELFFGEDETNA
jgi:hypothetical protein